MCWGTDWQVAAIDMWIICYMCWSIHWQDAAIYSPYPNPNPNPTLKLSPSQNLTCITSLQYTRTLIDVQYMAQHYRHVAQICSAGQNMALRAAKGLNVICADEEGWSDAVIVESIKDNNHYLSKDCIWNIYFFSLECSSIHFLFEKWKYNESILINS